MWGLLIANTIGYRIDRIHGKDRKKFLTKEKTLLFQRLNENAKIAGPNIFKVLEIVGLDNLEKSGDNAKFSTESVCWTTIAPNR